jgi:hypothetical protein
MRHVEQEEEEAAVSDPGGLQLHLCIINLVIGTLYCSKVGGCLSRKAGSLLGWTVAERLWFRRLVAANSGSQLTCPGRWQRTTQQSR